MKVTVPTPALYPSAVAVLEHLQTGQSLTAVQAFKLLGINRLSARIMELRDAGFPIVTDRVCVKTRRRRAIIAKYSLALDETTNA